ncbi:MAG TPA: GT4 family glycosyltransferase PelF [Thermoanaerobaculia bacterium]|jgi:glycosyltransferase involved in cell wall biosynthesis|nr:GT4 family glycosyltransferase PelF [Thermoanaerobaculia bacterium]
MTQQLSVLLATEGTYPYGAGGVSTWCDALLRNTQDVRYTLLPIMMNPHIEAKFDPPPNVRRIIPVPLWGIEEPSEFAAGERFADLYERKQSTDDGRVEREFLPLFRQFLSAINSGGSDPAAFGQVLVAMEDYFRACDYNDTMKSRPVWETFAETMLDFSRNAAANLPEGARTHQLPTLFDLTECLRWLYRFLIVLTVRVPQTSVAHSTAAAFCGIPCITAKLRHGTPLIVTEHGVYLREQNLFLSRFRRLFFCKQFLLNLITAVVRANYFHADVVAPVCHYNTRWELAHGTPQHKIRVIYNGVDTDVFHCGPAETRPLHVIATARIDPLKDIETFLRVAARVRETHRDVRFTVYGAVADREYYEKCLALRRELNVDVAMGNAVDDVVAAYREADVVLLTSISEAFPYSVIEAMSCERPVVASDVGGVGEALEECGMLVRARDAEGFAAAVRQLLDDPALRQRYAKRARTRVLEEFRLDDCVAAYLDLYRSLAHIEVAA